MNTAIQRLFEKGFIVVVAAGNDAVDACTESLASAEKAVAVGAVASDHRITSFSNYGPCVTVYAAGINLNSSFNTGDDAYRILSGTSMAAPLISGNLAAILGNRLSLAKRADGRSVLAELMKKTNISATNITYLP